MAEPEPVVVPEPKGGPVDSAPIALEVKFSPRKLKIDGRKGKHHKARHLKARIRFAEGFDARKVDPSSVKIVTDNGSEIAARVMNRRGFLEKLAHDYRKPKRSISVRFDRQQVIAAVGCPQAPETMLTVRGNIFHNDETEAFEASGMIRLKVKKGGQCSAD